MVCFHVADVDISSSVRSPFSFCSPGVPHSLPMKAANEERIEGESGVCRVLLALTGGLTAAL